LFSNPVYFFSKSSFSLLKASSDNFPGIVNAPEGAA
jgi:hypothetical protein